MTTNSKSETRPSAPKPAAMLWDESFLWGVMAYEALETSGLSCDLIRSDDIKNGVLNGYRLLFVPGGWASNKMKALGDAGIEEIRRFVHAGGSYLGFCGGAGLATMDGIGLLPVKRRPTKDRVPSFSGPIMLNTVDHPFWQGIELPVFHAWWPSQFIAGQDVSVLATYGGAMPGAFSSDLNVRDTQASVGWAGLERAYQINLDPARLLHEPAVIEGAFGAGKVVLSLLHFDTPGDSNGARVLQNIWHCLVPNAERSRANRAESVQGAGTGPVDGLKTAVADVISLGERNFLWYWRNPLLLQWRRGVRGLEYCTLFIMVQKIADVLKRKGNITSLPDIEQVLLQAGNLLYPFVDKAKLLLVRERFMLQNTAITYVRCDDPDVQRLREELFSKSKSHGGLFKLVADELDRLLYRLLKEPV